jgi:signal transduction histidine kinase
VASLCLCAGAVIDLGMLHARTPEEWGKWLWWMQLPIFGLVTGIALFLRLYLRAGRTWLLVAVIALRSAALVVNFFSDPGLNFKHIDSIAQISFLGEPVTIVAGAATGDYQWLSLLSGVLFVVFILDAGVTCWRRNTRDDRRILASVVVPLVAAVVLDFALAQLAIWRIVALPFLFVPPFLIALTAMTVEMSRDLLGASRLARELRESQQRVELAAEAAGGGLWTWDVLTGRIWVTERARMILALPGTGEIQPGDVLRLVNERDIPHPQNSFEDALQRGGNYAMQFRVELCDGAGRWIMSRGSVQLGMNGKPVLVRGAVRDVTRERTADDEANELRRKLAHAGRVTMLGQLASGLAHELSQPMSAIQQNVETAQILLARNPLDVRELRNIVEDVLRDNRRGAEVVKRLRAWFTQGRINMEAVRMEEIVQDMVALVRTDASDKHVAIDCAIPRALPLLHGDRVHLSQVLLNLIMNAIEAAADGHGARREVLIEARAGADGWCEISVSDTGPGIPSEQLDRIFEPFVTAKAQGMGIGLSISRTIVEAHGGRLWAESSAGGATFRFTVPLHAANAAELACPA